MESRDLPFLHNSSHIKYWRKEDSQQNFGDYLSEFILSRVFRYPKVEASAYHLIGSVIYEIMVAHDVNELPPAAPPIAFWCCGVRSEEGLSAAVRARTMFFGVRGPISRDVLGLPHDTVLGDPGLLLPLIHKPNPQTDTIGKSICIPHVLDERSEEELLECSGTDMLVRPIIAKDFTALATILDRIIAADFVLTASLHGAIVAFAYDRPFAFWDNGHLDVPVKWRDFALSVGIEANFHPNIQAAREAYHAFAPQLVKRPLTPLLEVAPFVARPSLLLRAKVMDGAMSESDAAPAIEQLEEIERSEDRFLSTLAPFRDQLAARTYRKRLDIKRSCLNFLHKCKTSLKRRIDAAMR